MTRGTPRLVAAALFGLMSWGWVSAWAYCPHEAAPVAVEAAGHAHGDADDGGRERTPFVPECPAASPASGCTMAAHAITPGEAPPTAETAAAVAWPSSLLPPAVSPASIFRPPIG